MTERNNIEDLHPKIKDWSRVDYFRSCMKIALYYALISLLAMATLWARHWAIALPFQLAMGVTFAHGLELQHEALHLQLFRSQKISRLIGRLLGMPMLVSYTHYRRQHLHHHRYLGTDKNRELFNYEASLLRGPLAFCIRAWNVARLPTFLLTLLGILQGAYPDSVSGPQDRRHLRQEYLVLAIVFTAAVALSTTGTTTVLLRIWLIPWLLFGEIVHFFIELPEHLGCDQSSPDAYVSTRSYNTNCVLAYIVNGNNYHVEHHLYPSVTVRNLVKVHHGIRSRIVRYCPSYRSALTDVFVTKNGNS
jgi:fatty acid desaturase